MVVIECRNFNENKMVMKWDPFSIQDISPAEPVIRVHRTLLEEVVNIILNQMLIKFVRFQIQNWMQSGNGNKIWHFARG